MSVADLLAPPTRFDPARTRRLVAEAIPVDTAEHVDAVDPRRLYVPRQHLRALLPEVSLVVGTRGAGKTMWFEALMSPESMGSVRIRGGSDGVRLAKLRTRRGFGVGNRPDEHPSARVLAQLSNEFPADAIWRSVVAYQLLDHQTVPRELSWTERVRWVLTHPEDVDRALAALDQRAVRDDEYHVVLFDALDRLGSNWSVVRPLLTGLFEVLLELRGTRRLSGKAFVRPDMLKRLNFPDASKLQASRADLYWPRLSLYALLFHLLGNSDSVDAQWFRDETAALCGQPWGQAEGTATLPPFLEGDENHQTSVFHAMTGPFMGTNVKRGRPYTWLPNNLADANTVVSPRSLLIAVREAGQEAEHRYASSPVALPWQSVKSGVKEASRTRVDEIVEDMPWVGEALNSLKGLSLPVAEDQVMDRWNPAVLLAIEQAGVADDDADDRLGPDLRRGPVGILEQLIELGLLRETRDHRLNMPEVYRIAFGLGRRGGVPRL